MPDVPRKSGEQTWAEKLGKKNPTGRWGLRVIVVVANTISIYRDVCVVIINILSFLFLLLLLLLLLF